MERLITFFIKKKILTRMILFFVIVGGLYSMLSIRRESFPSVSFNTITISAIYPGAAPEDVELNVTTPIERQLAEVNGIDYMTSVSTENLSLITIQADDELGRNDMQRVLDDIRSAVDRVKDLPLDLDGKPTVAEMRIEDMPILEVALSGPMNILKILSLELEIELKDLNGVAMVTKAGYFEPEIQVEIDPWRMQQQHISFDEIINSILSRNVRASGGSFNSYIGKQQIVTLSKFKKPMDVKKVILRSNFEQRRVVLSDVARVRMGEKDERLMVRSNGRQGISLVLTKKPTADIIKTIDRVKALMKKRHIPSGVKYTFIDDASKRTRARISILEDNGMMGFILVFLMLVLFLNHKTAFWAAFGIPFSILGAFIVMPFVGLTINNISLAGFLIVIGMLVDDAIVVAEHVESYKEDGMDPIKAAVKGTKEMARPVTAAVLTTIAAYMPMYFLGGKMGKFAWAIPLVVSITLLVSLFECLLILPGHVAHGKKDKKGKKAVRTKAEWIIKMEEKYTILLAGVLRRKYLMVASLVLLFIFSFLFMGKNIKMVMMPSSGSEKFFIKYEAPIGSSIQRTAKDVIKVENVLRKMKKMKGEITSYASRVGHMNTGGNGAAKTSGDHENYAVTTVFLTPVGKRARSAKAIIRAVRRKIKSIKKTKISFEEKKAGPATGKPMEIMVIGNNIKKREKAVKKIMSFVKKIKGVRYIERDDKDGKRQLVIRFNYRKLAAYSLTTSDIAKMIRIAFDGQKVTSIQTLDQEIFYRVILAPRYRGRADSIRYLKVRNKMGQLINVKDLLHFQSIPSKQDLRHYNGRQAVTVSAQVDARFISPRKVGKLVKKKLLSRWSPPVGVKVLVGGEAKETGKMLSGAVFAGAFSLAVIFFLVIMVLNNASQTIFVMSVIPFTLIGVIWTHYFHGMNFSMFSIMGMLGLIGVVVNDSIVMVDRLNAAVHEKGLSLENIARQASTRLRPILLTTVTTIVGLLPSGYGIGGSDPMIGPLALTIAYGLLFATVITLFLVPSLYLIQKDFTNIKVFILGKFRKKA